MRLYGATCSATYSTTNSRSIVSATATTKYQQERLDTITRHAATRSRFYAHRFAGLVPDSGPVDLHALPPLDKPELMEHFEEVVTNPTLRRDELLAHVESVTADVLFRDELRVIATSGSSGFRGLFVYGACDGRHPAREPVGGTHALGAAPSWRFRVGLKRRAYEPALQREP